MQPTARVAVVGESTEIPAALKAISQGGMGMVAVLGANGDLAGIFTDGDLRRALEKLGDLRQIKVGEVMGRNPRVIGPDRLAVEAVEMMERLKLNQLLVTDDAGQLLGALNMHDLFRAKVV
jgi:arabinose-5-phosphate isomerase